MSVPAHIAGLKARRVEFVPVGDLQPDPANPRRSFDKAELAQLTESIKQIGVRQPLTVRIVGNDELRIVTGHRRQLAAIVAGLETVPCILSTDDDDAIGRGIAQVAENSARANLSTMDLARWMQRLQCDEHKSRNEIAALLKGAGLKALKATQIDDLIRLATMPTWVQTMVDAQQIEPGVASLLRAIEDHPACLKYARDEITRQLKWTGSLGSDDMKEAIDSALDKELQTLTRTDSYYQNPTLFDWKTRCKGCEHLKKFNNGAWCASDKLYAEHQAEAKEAGLTAGGRRVKKEEPEQPAKEKIEQRERSLADKARDYLHAYLARKLIDFVTADPGIYRRVVVWAALKKPGQQHGTRGSLPGQFEATAAQACNVNGIDDLLTNWRDEVELRAAQEVVADMGWREVLVMARHWEPTSTYDRHVNGGLSVWWSLDADFLKLFRKAELIHLANVHGVALPVGRRSWESMKTAEIHAAILAEPYMITDPQILVDLYENVPELFVPWSQRGDDCGDDDGVDADGAEDAE